MHLWANEVGGKGREDRERKRGGGEERAEIKEGNRRKGGGKQRDKAAIKRSVKTREKRETEGNTISDDKLCQCTS